MIRKKLTAIMTAAMMMFCILCGGNLQSVSADVADKTVYIAVQPSAGMPGSRVPVTIDIRTDYFVSMMSVRVHYDSHLNLVPADPAVPDEPKSEVDLRSTDHEKPHTSGYDIVSGRQNIDNLAFSFVAPLQS